MNINELLDAQNKHTTEWLSKVWDWGINNPEQARSQLGARDFLDGVSPASQNPDYLRGYYKQKAKLL